jgi:hypothetical protein
MQIINDFVRVFVFQYLLCCGAPLNSRHNAYSLEDVLLICDPGKTVEAVLVLSILLMSLFYASFNLLSEAIL